MMLILKDLKSLDKAIKKNLLVERLANKVIKKVDELVVILRDLS